MPLQAVLHILGNGGASFQSVFTLGNGEVLEGLAIFCFLQKLFAGSVEKGDGTRLFVHDSLYVAGFHDDISAIFRHVECRNGLLLRHNHQTRLRRQRIFAGSLHANDVVVDYLQSHNLGTSVLRSSNIDGNTVTTLHKVCCRSH